MLTDPKEPIDKLEDLATDEWESLREWEVNKFILGVCMCSILKCSFLLFI
jgi:hypothetical protein